MTTRLLIFFILCSLTTLAENKLARIVDPDGYTNIRSGPGKEYEIVARIEKDEFFYCDLTNSDWVKVIALKWQDSKQIEGFIHKSRIQLIENLDNTSKRILIKSILQKQQLLAQKFQKVCNNHDSALSNKTASESEDFSEIKYSPILEILPKYFCSTSDTTILQQLFATIWADASSANESPSFAVGECYICKSDLVLAQLKQIKKAEMLKILFDDIEWGLMNYYGIGEDEKTENKDFNKLKKQLDLERKKACP